MINNLRLLILFLGIQFVSGQIPEDKAVISSIYVYDIEKRKPIKLTTVERHLEAPNWSIDNNYLLINSSGKLEKFDLSGNFLEYEDTGHLSMLNNDHGYSFDGKNLFFSTGILEIEGHSSFIYMKSLDDNSIELLTELTPSYWHGVSPDGNYIVYCAERNGEYDVYKLNIETKNEIRLTFNKGLDDGPEFSPDGKYIYYNSFKTNKMQIWRMHNDGSNQEQMTFDNYSNWFPHVSPKNDYAVVISYIEDQEQSHPFGRMVKLRLLNLTDKTIVDLTEPFYGGQGTINVPSWNPEGTKFAYVLYSLKDK